MCGCVGCYIICIPCLCLCPKSQQSGKHLVLCQCRKKPNAKALKDLRPIALKSRYEMF